MAIRICPSCGGKVSTTRNDCIHCGHVFITTKRCPECEEDVDISLSNCPSCGYSFNEEVKEIPVEEKTEEKIESAVGEEEKTQETDVVAPLVLEEDLAEQEQSLVVPEEVVEQEQSLVVPEEVVEQEQVLTVVQEENCEDVIENDSNNALDKIECPYCHESKHMQIGKGFYMCEVCKGKFLDANGTTENLPLEDSSSPNEEVLVESNSALQSEENVESEESFEETENVQDNVEAEETESVQENAETEENIEEIENAQENEDVETRLEEQEDLDNTVLENEEIALGQDEKKVVPKKETEEKNTQKSENSQIRSTQRNLFIGICFVISVASLVLSLVFGIVSCNRWSKTEKYLEDGQHYYGQWIEWTTDDTLACDERIFYQICSICNDVEWKMGKDHDWQQGYSSDITFHWVKCNDCGATKGTEAHTANEENVCSTCARPLGTTPGLIYDLSSDYTYAEVIGYNGSAKKIVIADTYSGLPVKNIYQEAFKNNDNITSVTIPNSVTSIGDDAFYGCNSLRSIVIGKNVTSIGGYAFYNCSSLTSIEIPDSVTAIGNGAFSSCYNLENIVIGDGVTSIGSSAFSYCHSSLYTTENNLKYVKANGNSYYLLMDATNNNLSTYTINGNTVHIGAYAFEYCSRLSSIAIPKNVKSIGSYAFVYCNSLTKITFNGSMAKWNAISKGYLGYFPATKVVCTNGEVTIS